MLFMLSISAMQVDYTHLCQHLVPDSENTAKAKEARASIWLHTHLNFRFLSTLRVELPPFLALACAFCCAWICGAGVSNRFRKGLTGEGVRLPSEVHEP